MTMEKMGQVAREVFGHYTLAQLEALPTLHQGQFDNLKFDKGDYRVWLSRVGVADGMPYDNEVTVEQLVDGVWVEVAKWEAT